jgi:hypothetical protein
MLELFGPLENAWSMALIVQFLEENLKQDSQVSQNKILHFIPEILA